MMWHELSGRKREAIRQRAMKYLPFTIRTTPGETLLYHWHRTFLRWLRRVGGRAGAMDVYCFNLRFMAKHPHTISSGLCDPMMDLVHIAERCCRYGFRAHNVPKQYTSNEARRLARLNVDEVYVRGLIANRAKLPAKCIPECMVGAEQAHIKLTRLIKEFRT